MEDAISLKKRLIALLKGHGVLIEEILEETVEPRGLLLALLNAHVMDAIPEISSSPKKITIMATVPENTPIKHPSL